MLSILFFVRWSHGGAHPDEIVRLTPPERLALIAQLWDSLEHHQLPLTSAQEAELDRRLSSLDQDRRNGVTWASLSNP